MPRPTALDAARQFRQQLAGQEAAAVERMGLIYARIYRDMVDQTERLADDIAAMDEPSRGKITKLARLQQLLRQVEDQAARFGQTVQGEITVVQNQAIQQGVSDALKLMELSLPDLPPELRRVITGSFTRLPVDAIEAAAGLFGADSPLTERLTGAFGQAVAQQVEQHIVDGIAAGMNPRRIASLLQRNLQNSLGAGLTWTLTTVRTAQIKSYQLANHATYQANPRIVPEWVWVSALDSRTCMSCIAQHGSVHPITETLNDHQNGRCAPVPKTISYRDLGITGIPDPVEPFESGEDWFSKQPEATQRQAMGPAMFKAFKDNRFSFRDLSRPYQDEVYGELLREASLRDLLGEQAKEYYRQ